MFVKKFFFLSSDSSLLSLAEVNGIISPYKSHIETNWHLKERGNNMKKRLFAALLAGSLAVAALSTVTAYADGQKVVTLGADLSEEQKTAILKYFGVYGQNLKTLYITNQDERNHLASYVPIEQIGTHTFSCALVNPTMSGGIRVKTANLNWVTSNMIATTLSTSGVVNCEVLAASPFEVSGTGALTGIIMAYETASGTTLNETKKELATQELVTTGTIANQVGQAQATDIVNEIKIQVIENQVTDTEQVVEIVNDVLDEKLDVEAKLSDEDRQLLLDLAEQIAQQDYDYEEMRETLERVENNMNELNSTVNQVAGAVEDNTAAVEENTAAVAENTAAVEDNTAALEDNTAAVEDNTAALDTLNDHLSQDSILLNTDDTALGDNVIMDATDEEALQDVKGAEEGTAEPAPDAGFEITTSDDWTDGGAAQDISAEPAPTYEQPTYEEPQPEQPGDFFDIGTTDEYTDEGSFSEPAPAAEEPTYEEPTYEEPTYEEPTYEEPQPEEPAYEEPTYEEPQPEEPTYEEPTYEEPTYEEPTYEEPQPEEPAYEEPTYEEEEPEGASLEISETSLTVADAADEYSAAGAGMLKLLIGNANIVPVSGTVTVTDSFGTTSTVDLANTSQVTADPMSADELMDEGWSEGTRVLIVLGDAFQANMTYDVTIEGTFAQADDQSVTAQVSESANFATESYGAAVKVATVDDLSAGKNLTVDVMFDDATAVRAEVSVEDQNIAYADTAELALSEGQTSFNVTTVSAGITQLNVNFYDAEGNVAGSTTVDLIVL